MGRLGKLRCHARENSRQSFYMNITRARRTTSYARTLIPTDSTLTAHQKQKIRHLLLACPMGRNAFEHHTPQRISLILSVSSASHLFSGARSADARTLHSQDVLASRSRLLAFVSLQKEKRCSSSFFYHFISCFRERMHRNSAYTRTSSDICRANFSHKILMYRI